MIRRNLTESFHKEIRCYSGRSVKSVTKNVVQLHGVIDVNLKLSARERIVCVLVVESYVKPLLIGNHFLTLTDLVIGYNSKTCIERMGRRNSLIGIRLNFTQLTQSVTNSDTVG